MKPLSRTLFAVVLLALCRLTAQAAQPMDLATRLGRLDEFYAARLKQITGSSQRTQLRGWQTYRTQLDSLLKRKQADGNSEHAAEVKSELARLSAGKPTTDPAIHARSCPELSELVAARTRSETQSGGRAAEEITQLGDQLLNALRRLESDLTAKNDERGAATVREKFRQINTRPEVVNARKRAEQYREETERSLSETRKKKFLADLAEGRFGPFAPRAPDAKWQPRLDFDTAWMRMQKLDCDYSVFEYFSGRSIPQLLPQASGKPEAERLNYLLYMLFNGLDRVNAIRQLKTFNPEKVLQAARTSFWPAELHPLKADGARLWAASASFIKDGAAHNILQLAVNRQEGKDEIESISAYRSAPVPEKGWQSVPPSSYLAENSSR